MSILTTYTKFRSNEFEFSTDIKPIVETDLNDDVPVFKYRDIISIQTHIENVFMICKNIIDTNKTNEVLKQPTLDFKDGIFTPSLLSSIRIELLHVFEILGLDYSTVSGFKSFSMYKNNPVIELIHMVDTFQIKYATHHINSSYITNICFYIKNVLYIYYNRVLSIDTPYSMNKDLQELFNIFKFAALYARNTKLLKLRDQIYAQIASADIYLNNLSYLYNNSENPDSYLYNNSDDYSFIAIETLNTLNDIETTYSMMVKEFNRICDGCIHDNKFKLNKTDIRDQFIFNGVFDKDNGSSKGGFQIIPKITIEDADKDYTHNLYGVIDSPYSYDIPKTIGEVFKYINKDK